MKTNLTRQYGRSLCGKRLEMDAPFGAWGTQTFIAGLKHDNLADQGSNGRPEGYVPVLAPQLQPGIIYLAIAAATLREVGCWFLYLPPYCQTSILSKWHSSKHTWRNISSTHLPKSAISRTPRMLECEAGYGSLKARRFKSRLAYMAMRMRHFWR